MATNVTVTKVYANPDHFQGKNTPQYVYSINSGNTSPGIQWSGSTLNGVGTYLAPGFVKSNEKLLFDGFALSAGTFTGPYGTSTFTASVGSDQVGENGRLELIGNQTTFASVGGISIHNEASAHATKTIFDLTVSRWTDDDEAILAMSIGDTGANLNQFYVVTSAQQQWKVGFLAKMNLTADTLAPEGGQTVDLGAGVTPWSTIYVNNITVPTLAGTGNRLTYMDAGGVFGDIDWLTYSSTSILEIGTGQSSASLALEYGDTNPYELSANTTDGMYIHQYSSKIMHFTTSLITAVVDVRLDALAGIGDRIVVADADGDLSASTTIADIVSFGLTTEIPYTNVAGDDFSYDANFTYAASSLSVPGIVTDSIAEKTASAGVNIEGVVLKDDDVTIPVDTGRIIFGNGDTYIREATDNNLYIYVGGTLQQYLSGTTMRTYTTARFDGALSVYTASDTVLSLYQTDAGGTPGTPEGGWNYVSFYDGDGDRQGYFGIDTTGNMRFVPEVAGAALYSTVDFMTSSNYRGLSSGNSDLGTSSIWFGNSYVDTMYIDSTDTYIARDVSGNMTFVDGVTSVKTLAELAAGGGTSVSFGLSTQIPYTNATVDDFIYATDFTFDGTDLKIPGGLFAASLTEGQDGDYIMNWDSATGEIGYDNDILITGAPSGIRFASAASTLSWVGTGTEIWLDGTNNLTFKDAVTGTLTLADIAALEPAYGTVGQIPYTNTGADGFSYTSELTYSDPFLTLKQGDESIILDGQGAINTYSNDTAEASHYVYASTAGPAYSINSYRRGGTITSPATPPSNAVIRDDYFYVYDGGAYRNSAGFRVEVVGAIASNNLDTQMEWFVRDGASASAVGMTLGTAGLTTANDLISGGDIIAQSISSGTDGDYLVTWDAATGKLISDSTLLATADGIRMSTSGAKLAFDAGLSYIDTTGAEMQFTDILNGTQKLSDLISGTAAWQVNSNLITTATALDDIQLVAGEQLRFGSSSNRIEYIATNKIRITTAGTSNVDFDSNGNMTVYNAILPDTNGSNIGTTGLFWGTVNSDAYNIEDGSTTIDQDASTNMVLTDAVSGAHTLSELASGHKIVRIQHSDDGVTIDIADLGLGDVAWSDISIMMYVVTAFNSSAPQLHIGNTAHTSTYYLAAGNPGWSTTGFKTFSLNNDPNFISGNETINCQYNDASADGSTGDCYLYFSYISA